MYGFVIIFRKFPPILTAPVSLVDSAKKCYQISLLTNEMGALSVNFECTWKLTEVEIKFKTNGDSTHPFLVKKLVKKYNISGSL